MKASLQCGDFGILVLFLSLGGPSIHPSIPPSLQPSIHPSTQALRNNLKTLPADGATDEAAHDEAKRQVAHDAFNAEIADLKKKLDDLGQPPTSGTKEEYEEWMRERKKVGPGTVSDFWDQG